MFLKIHRSPGTGDVVAVCDRELLNTTITDGDLRVTISDGFYGTTCVDEAAVTEALSRGDNINLMGERSVGVAVKLGLVSRADCIIIGSVPHVQIYRF
ncbi:MAG: DUF424 domain-containing protein [Methanoregula sp.]|jgi:hypothetical protein|uniref:DUF424 domain-containing protein n=1 Tax=Methanoregula sp. TaxID=2052170 RepID=UPI003C2A109F